MKKIIPLCYAMASWLTGFGQTTIGGVITQDSVFTLAHSPYIVTSNLLVQEGVSVSVEPGVEFLFDDNIFLQVDGELRAIGTAADSIIFTKSPGATNGWGGIRFTDSAVDFKPESSSGCILSYCRIAYTAFSGNTDQIISANFTSILIQHCDVSHYHDGIWLRHSTSTVRNCRIHDGEYLSLAVEGINTDSMAYVSGNEIFNNFHPNTNSDITLDHVLFENNYVHDISTTYAVTLNLASIVAGNVIEDSDVGLHILPDLTGHTNNIVVCNTFNNNNINLSLECEMHPYLVNNNFISPLTYNVVTDYQNVPDCFPDLGSGEYASIDFSTNYWGDLSNEDIDASIRDFNDDFTLQMQIEYEPKRVDSVVFATADCSYSLITAVANQVRKKEGVSIYPNPASTTVTIESQAGKGLYQVFDITGKQLAEGTIPASRFTLDISRYDSGLYLLSLFDGSHVINSRLVRE